MLPASNRGVGMNIGFPDVCLTPAGPAVVPIPYPNIAMNVQAAPFSVLVLITMMNALNMASKILMTSGDEAGVAHPMIKQMGAYTMGNPIVFIEKLPGINLLCPTTGNNMNNPVGAVLVPSVTNVLYTRLQPSAEGADPFRRAVSVDDLRALDGAAGPPVREAMLGAGIGCVTIDLFTFDLSSLVYSAIRRLAGEGMRVLILDLRGNPGGEMDAFLRLADDFLPSGSALGEMVDGDGDTTVFEARQDDPYPYPLVVLVDRETASAAELFAGCMQAHGRAVIVGERTYGKGVAQQVVTDPEGRGALYVTAASFTLPGGGVIQGAGVCPDVEVPREGPAERDRERDAQLGAAFAIAEECIAVEGG